MLDLDKYIANNIEIKLNGEVIHVKEPSLRMVEKLDAIEVDLTKENLIEKRLQAALLFINNNCEDRKISEDELKDIPIEGIVKIVDDVSKMRIKVDQDPN